MNKIDENMYLVLSVDMYPLVCGASIKINNFKYY